MSIRKKFLIVIITIFIINTLMLLGFYKLHIYPTNSKQLSLIKTELIDIITVNVEDMDVRTQLIKNITEEFKVENIRKHSAQNLIESILEFEILVIALVLIAASILIYITIVKPIEILNKNMKNYSKGAKINSFKKRGDEIGRLQDSFLKLVDTVEDEKEKQNKIVASIAHDIKTPLTSIMGYSERLIKKELPQQKQKLYLNTIYSKSQIINELINDFDEYTSYNFEKQLSLKTYDIEAICNILDSEYRYELEDRGIDFSIVNKCVREEVTLDLIKFKRVIGNIISNSIKSIKAKGKIEIHISGGNKAVVFSIIDNGSGVDENILNNIFDPLFTTDTSRKVAGLGLAICKSIVEAHNGKITAKNIEGRGFKVEIAIPRGN